MQDLEPILRCPVCESGVLAGRCLGEGCVNAAGFPVTAGQPVMIDFEDSIFERAAYAGGSGSVLKRDPARKSLRARVDAVLFGENRVAQRIAGLLLEQLRVQGGRPRLLVVGGGAKGSGADALYEADAIALVGVDVYASPYTRLVADGHRLPFQDASFDAVWIQAVLEHVLDPAVVVAELHRVLKPQGLVFADTPFMQQVHEGAYDFTRFTLSGHRWLFRRFEEIESGATAGAGTVAIWSARALLRALGLPSKLTVAAAYLFFPLRLLDNVGPRRNRADGASGVYFYGRRSTETLRPKDMLAFYANQAKSPA